MSYQRTTPLRGTAADADAVDPRPASRATTSPFPGPVTSASTSPTTSASPAL